MENIKIIIEVQGGIVQAVYSSKASIDIEIVDFDNEDDNATESSYVNTADYTRIY